MAQIYRKSLIDKLSSPEQLDKRIVITSPSFWVAVLGATVIVAVAAFWAFFGKLPQKVEAGGIYMDKGGVGLVYSDIVGKVTDINVAPGDVVTKGQVLLSVDNGELLEEIQSLQDRITAVELITVDSVGDKATADNKDLLNIKFQKSNVGIQLKQNQQSLTTAKSNYNAQKALVDNLYKNLIVLQNEYYGTLGKAPSIDSQVAYEDHRQRIAKKM